MASFNSLPSELVVKVIDLAVEDYVALEQETSRRRILSSLALVSTIFTLPAQQALWRYVYFQSSDHLRFITVIRTGFGGDKKVKRLIFTLNSGGVQGEEGVKWLLEILSGIKDVEELDLYNNCGKSDYWPYFFEIASVKDVKRLKLDNIVVQLEPTTFPTTLRHLNFADIESAESLLSQLSLNPSVAVDTIKFDFDDYLDFSITQYQVLISYFELHGANLRNLSFECFSPSMILILLPHTPSLLNLTLPTKRNSMQTTLKYLQALPSSTRLNSLQIGFFDIDDCIELNFFLPLLVLPQLSHLKLLCMQLYNDVYAEFYEEGRLGKVQNGLAIKKAFDQSVKLCRDRGIRLSFRSQREEHFSTEKRKQDRYEKRQKELDRR